MRDRDMDAVFRALSDPGEAPAPRQAQRAQRAHPHRALRRHGHDQAVGLQAPRCARDGRSRHHPQAGEREAALPRRRPDQRHRRPLDPPLRPGAGRGPVRSQDGTGGHHHEHDDTTTSTTAPDQRDTTFVYTTYIHATPEKVWQGLTDPAFTKQYWRHPTAGGVEMRTDWKKGSTYDVTYEQSGLVISHPDQVILESDPYRRLAYTWHTFTPEWAAAHGIDQALARRVGRRATLQGLVRHRGRGQWRGQAHRRARRLRAGQRGAPGRQRRLAGRHLRPEDVVGDRVSPAIRLTGGVPPFPPTLPYLRA